MTLPVHDAEKLYIKTLRAHKIVKYSNVALFSMLPILGYILYISYVTPYQSCLIAGISMLGIKMVIDNQLATMRSFTALVADVMLQAQKDKRENVINNPYEHSKFPALRNIYKLT